ncbi:hypothetical protein HYDPIDRAFT_30514 [Hydnomerulius pinastri MD-312]|uniref:Unplaced genomic scaffold scaffold_22, whole genome shotgun sequence n=1 Tax=Hydnomerulius pinastri MD-312 TaxID=994086 RepID=A0A0C9W628_9AGAM|nr:hypothetical protein HYDPIDRAFT_30514 [Hydnomerulius pinastri MD-312]
MHKIRTAITFFDIQTTIPGPVPTSPNTWRVRLILNYKNLAYETCWVEAADIETVCKSRGIPPSSTKPDGTPKYTLPAIIDCQPSGTVCVSESVLITEYLEKTYPDDDATRAIIPPGKKSLLLSFEHKIALTITSQLWPLIALDMYSKKTPRDKRHFRQRMEAAFGKPLEEIPLVGEERQELWRKVECAFDAAAKGLGRDDRQDPMSPGNHPSFVDFTLCGLLLMFFHIAPDEAWPKICGWNGGFWGKYFSAFQSLMLIGDEQLLL